MPKFSVFIATSLDGFIARPNGDIDWLNEASEETKDSGENYGYEDFISSIDLLVMGRKSFEKVASFDFWPYKNTRVLVLSRSLNELPEEYADKAELFSGDTKSLLSKLKSEEVQRVYVDGGKVIQSFLREGLITDLILTTIPILLGDGLPLFGHLPKDIHLELLSTKPFQSGFIQSHYKVLC